MQMIRRILLLIVYLVSGYLVGNLIGRLVLIPLAGVKASNVGLVDGLAVFTGAIGALLALGMWNRRFAAGPSYGVHGSARWANADEVRTSLGGPGGLIVGRENREGGGLLRYSGDRQAPLLHQPSGGAEGKSRPPQPWHHASAQSGSQVRRREYADSSTS